MKIDRSVGKWCIKDGTFNVTELDDIAYYIYCHRRKNRMPTNIAPQSAFLIHPKVYKTFYEQAQNIMRIKKIKKICQKNQY
jgi:hypothetical protein